jgi:predicted metalloprotease
MVFNPGSDISGGRTSKRGRNTGIALGGGGGLVVVALILISAFTGVDLTGLSGMVGGTGTGTAVSEPLAECETGADANAKVECLMKGGAASLDVYWSTAAGQIGVAYTPPADVILFTESTSTGCGNATSAVGPFYCPTDQTIYLDVAFFEDLRTKYGSTGGTLAELYVLAHEWGHHIQNLSGTLASAQDGDTGEASASVKVELQADCFAGAWVGSAATTTDENGVTFLEPITDEQLSDALSAAEAVGDDRIQGDQANPETWTHGSSEERRNWFVTGYNDGAAACDTGLGL